jgi:peptidoglycan hydrolase-like protein with peptidoglycan-binding domain
MKRMIDSFIKNIVRQSLNENYGLLNEGSDPKCPEKSFCLNDGSLKTAQDLSKKLSPLGGGPYADGQKLMRDLSSYCNSLNYGPANEGLATKVVDDIAMEYSNNNPDETKVKRLINSLFFPEWCLVIDLAISKGEGGGVVNAAGNTKRNNFWERVEVGGQDYLSVVVNPSIQVFYKTIKKTVEAKKIYDEKRSTDKTKWYEELKKSGWGNDENGEMVKDPDKLAKAYAEWKAAGWEPKPKEYTVGSGGEGINFTNYECITQHPAVEKTGGKIKQYNIKPTNFGGGIGYKLQTNNPNIDKFIYGVVKRSEEKDSTDMGALYDMDQKITIEIDCTHKFLQHSLSTTPWNYNAVIDSGGKIALTTNPKYNNNIQIESIKGFRHNLLTEQEYKLGDTKPGIETIQKKLGITPKTPVVYDQDTKDAVIRFQRIVGGKLKPPIPMTGIVDDITLQAIMDLKPTDNWTLVDPSATEWRRDLKIGSVGVDVEAIQTKLNIPKGGYKVGTENAVKSFQTKYNILPVTGIVDETTFYKIMSMDAVGTDDTYSGKRHNYKSGEWIRITPNDNDNQLSANNGYFRITKIVDEYTVVIDVPLVVSGTTGGSTQRVLFGEEAKEGTQEVIKGDRNNSGTRTKEKKARKERTSTNNVETTKRRDTRNSEYCDSLRKIKKHLNLKVDCKKYQSTLNKIMLALTGGVEIKPVAPVAPVAPVSPVAPITPSGNVTIY